MNLQEHIDIIKALPIKYKRELLRLFFEILEEHFCKDGRIRESLNDDFVTDEGMTVDQFINQCCAYVPTTNAVKPLKNPNIQFYRERGTRHESKNNLRTNNKTTNPKRLPLPTKH